ncbi:MULTISPECIES: inositol monophosphatase family protein [unclassified Francisella]|uniref:inositol monophosphatase family protein n=1 Tax=unclassified Francisella TaxID=2610885 RepID=UPI002E2EC066|nr:MULTISPECIES: inositol monophosphatase family protein [unclassified Francisella]MED7819837.1 inositol monophosphatase family protein [Francisella sp. 19S2-4]MED7830648.1 inositol monophosphatase family protein [Francisella sp. 19S2-10]
MITKNLIQIINSAADKAGMILNKHYRNLDTVISKDDNSLVTLADQQAERVIRETILENFPQHGITGEEESTINPNSDYMWVIDPIDGTDSYVLGRPLFCVLIGLFYKGKPILSLVDQPFTRERWIGYDNKSIYNNDTVIKTSNKQTIQDSKIILSSPYLFENKTSFVKNIRKLAKIVAWEAEAYAFGLLAMGCIDVVIKPMLDTYDYLPVIKLIQNAGGAIAAANGNDLTMDYTGDIIAAASKELLDNIINIYNYEETL